MNIRSAIASVVLLAVLCAVATAQDAAIADRKLVEYGWDVPTSDFVAAHIAEMEQRPFDGLIFRLQTGSNVLEPAAWGEAKFKADFDVLPTIAWNKFTDNFVIMHAASNQDWFDDAHWQAIEGNVAFVSRAARLAKCVGVCFDPEPYGANPWSYKDAAHAADKPFAEYKQIARKRGAQFMRAIQRELPKPKILSFYMVALFRKALGPVTVEARDDILSKHDYSLLPAFFEGMLEAAEPGAEIIDGNESAYYYTDRLPYFEAYQTVHGRGPRLIDPALEPAFRSTLRMGQALYIDQYYGMREGTPTLGNFMSPEQQAQWFEHNVYWALYTTDRYVWCYSERMNWWKNENIPPGSEEAIRSARGKIARGEELGFDLAPTIEAAAARQKEGQ